LGELFDSDSLITDYKKSGIHINPDRNKEIAYYFENDCWDGQDDNSTELWETGLILGYPIENTISLYNS